MLSIFPDLLSFGLLAPFLLRLVAGSYLLRIGLAHLKINGHTGEEIAAAESVGVKPGAYLVWGVAGIEIIGGVMLIAGFLTQIAALVLSILLIVALILRKKNHHLFLHNKNLYILLLVICISLLFSGAGFMAVDLPL